MIGRNGYLYFRVQIKVDNRVDSERRFKLQIGFPRAFENGAYSVANVSFIAFVRWRYIGGQSEPKRILILTDGNVEAFQCWNRKMASF